jgi:hypothetical protein
VYLKRFSWVGNEEMKLVGPHTTLPNDELLIWYLCCDLKNISAEKFGEKVAFWIQNTVF